MCPNIFIPCLSGSLDDSSAIIQSLDVLQRKDLEKRLGAQAGDLILFGVDSTDTVSRALGRLRTFIAEGLDLIDKVCWLSLLFAIEIFVVIYLCRIQLMEYIFRNRLFLGLAPNIIA